MNADRWRKIKELFDEALAQPPAERSAWLAAASDGDADLRADVERLLAADDRAEGFLDPIFPASPGLEPGRRLGRYEILSPLGEGGMGAVYRARDTLLERVVAIKLLHAAAAGAGAVLLREARAASALNHPHICTIHGIEETSGRTFIVMEHVSGAPLNAAGTDAGLPMARVRDYGMQIAEAVAHAHDHGVIHRDLKCANVLLTPQGRVKVLDFGIAAHAASGEAQPDTAAWAGTPAYMPPERLRGESGDARSDIWALGVMLHEMAVGATPFAGESPTDIRAAVLAGRLQALPGSVAPELAAIVRRCLAPDPDDRFQHASEVRAALESMPPNRGASTRRAVAAAAVLVLVLGIGVAVTWGPLRRGFAVRDTPPAAANRTTLAVLPFRPLVPANRDAAFELGIADTLITRLSGVPGVVVRPTSAVTRYADAAADALAAGRELRVDSVVDGTIQRTGDRLHVSVRLVSVADGRAVWGQTFDAANADVFSVEDAIAEAVATALVPALGQQARSRLVRHGTENVEAYRAYLQGRLLWNQRTESAFRQAIVAFDEAIAKDPRYALAYTGLADCYTLLGIWGAGPAAETVARAKVAALRAVALEDGLPEAHGSAALVRWVYDWDWNEAEREFGRAIELNPSYATARQWFAYFLASRGRFDDAIEEIGRARDLEPLSLSIRTDVGEIHAWAGQYDPAIAELRGVLDAAPDFLIARNILGLTYLLQHRHADGIAALERARQLDDSPRMISTLGFGYGMTGDRVGAQRLVGELERMSRRRYVSPFAFALIYAGMDDRERALTWLTRAFDERSDTIAILNVYPWLKGLRQDSRFAALAGRDPFFRRPAR